jgi:Ca2+-binding RTX toxin-like protein
VIQLASIPSLVFTPATNASGTPYASFTFSVQDSGDAFDPTPNTMTINVTAVGPAKITINGTNGNDSINLTKDNGQLKVTLNGRVTRFNLSSTTVIEVYGKNGNDFITISGLAHTVLVEGGNGNDIIVAADNDPSAVFALRGGSGNDILIGGRGFDLLVGGSGDDLLIGLGGNDRLKGEDGNDILLGGDGDDVLEGGKGNDVLIGGAGSDSLDGGPGKNVLLQESGPITLLAKSFLKSRPWLQEYL